MRRRLSIAALVFMASPAVASDAAEALVSEFGITTYTASRKDDNLYELTEGYIVKTRYCYEYVYYEDVVVTDDKIIFIDSDAVCDVVAIHKT